MPDRAKLLAHIENASEAITPFWPLKNFIAANPLAGFENMGFSEAVTKGADLFGGKGFPSRKMGQKALEKGLIDKKILLQTLQKNGVEALFDTMIDQTKKREMLSSPSTNALAPVDILFLKYLTAFLDEGQASWAMPEREKGFYSAWRALALHDSALPKDDIAALPEKALDALLEFTKDIQQDDLESALTAQLAALPGWAGFVKWRSRQKHYPWQKAYPISLTEYLAVRVAMVMISGGSLQQRANAESSKEDIEGLCWLEAWEETYRTQLLSRLRDNDKTSRDDSDEKRPDAQLVFCIDVRSEVIRRYIEAAAHYETFGFAGFFGAPIRHKAFGADIAVDSCPVLLQPQFETSEVACCGQEHATKTYASKQMSGKALGATIKDLKQDWAAAFAFIESAGIFYAARMIANTLSPVKVAFGRTVLGKVFLRKPKLKMTTAKEENQGHGLALSERIFHAEAALKIMGLTRNFAPIVLLTGHGSETINNPYAAGLDCGACGGNHGGPNARLMAAIFNEPAVRNALQERGIDIPDDTVFVGALHNTTTDEIDILDADLLAPAALKTLQDNLHQARISANIERCAKFGTKSLPLMRAADWAEVRPEWGLARNAAFIVGPRTLTKGLDLQGRTFLHSYNWEEDKDGKALEIILTAPMVVAEWINTQYYFSTVDNAHYGSGTKITHNVSGKIGVMQGNLSDLMTGLPLQSVASSDEEFYHEPLRLMTVVKAPIGRVTKLIAANKILQTLFDKGWVALTVMDPETGKTMRYGTGKTWHEFGASETIAAAHLQETKTSSKATASVLETV